MLHIPTEGTVTQICYDEWFYTRGNNVIDLVLINQPFLMPSLNVAVSFSSSDHNSVKFTIAIDHHNPKQPMSPKHTYLWKQGDYAVMTQDDWLHFVSIHLTLMISGELLVML